MTESVEASDDVARALRNAIKLGGSLLASWGVALAVRVLLPRSLGPAGFGVYSFADAFSTTCFILLNLGVDTYIHKEIPVRLSHASDFIGGVSVLRVGGGAVVAVLMWGGLLWGHRSTEVQEVVLLFAAVQLFSLNNDSLSALLHAAGTIDGLTVVNVVIKIGWGVSISILALTGSGLVAIAIATLVSELLRNALLAWFATRELEMRWTLDLRNAAVVLMASLPFFVNTIAHTAYGKVDATMLAFLASDAEVGYYGAASGLASVALVLTPLIGWVLMPLTARAASRSREELMILMRRSLSLILSLAIPIALGLWIGSDDLVQLAFGHVFRPSAITLRVLAPMFVVTYLAIVASTCLVRLDRAWTVTVISLGGLILTPLLNILLIRPSLAAFGPGGAGAGAAVALLVTEVSVSAAMVVALKASLFDGENLQVLFRSLGCAALVLLLDRTLLKDWGLARYPIEALIYLAVALWSGALRPREIWQVTSGALRQRKVS